MTSINLKTFHLLPAIFTSSWAAWSWIMIRCGPIKVAGSIDPLLRRRCSLTEAPPMANSWSPTRSPCSSAHVPFFLGGGKDSQTIFGKKNNMFKKLQQFSSWSTANEAIQTHIVERTFWHCHILITCEQLKNLVLSHLTILLPSRPLHHPLRLDSQTPSTPQPPTWFHLEDGTRCVESQPNGLWTTTEVHGNTHSLQHEWVWLLPSMFTQGVVVSCWYEFYDVHHFDQFWNVVYDYQGHDDLHHEFE